MRLSVMLWIASFLSQASPAPTTGQSAAAPQGAPSAGSVKIESVWDFVVKGGPVMFPIGLCSLAALTVIVERLLSLRRGAIIPPAFLPEIKRLLERNASGREDALSLCQRDSSPIARVFSAAIRRLDDSTESLSRHVEEAGARVVVDLRKNLRALSVIGSVSPLLGLLGTIFGMIEAFQTVAAAGESLGRTEVLAKGIYEAMITTAAGLIVAIPCVVAYHGFTGKIERAVRDMDELTVDFLESFGRPRSQPASETRPRLEAMASSAVQTAQPAAAPHVDGRPGAVMVGA